MADRKDAGQLSPESVQAGLTGENWVVIVADETARNAVTSDEAFSSAAPVSSGKVRYMPTSSFRRWRPCVLSGASRCGSWYGRR